MFILKFQLNFSNRLEGSLFNKRRVYYLAWLASKNFNQMIFLFKEAIFKYFFGKSDNFFRHFSTNICKNSFLNSPNVFPGEAFFPKSI